jgi:hypothetical protein
MPDGDGEVFRKVGADHFSFWCPGCGETHIICQHDPATGRGWSVSGDLVSPTVTPSILVRGGHYSEHFKKGQMTCWCDEPEFGFKCKRCHSFVEAGRIRFLDDCSHDLAGQTVDLPPVSDWKDSE